MLENPIKITDPEINTNGKYISVIFECGHDHLNINGKYLGETSEYFIINDRKNRIIYINKSKIIYHIFKNN